MSEKTSPSRSGSRSQRLIQTVMGKESCAAVKLHERGEIPENVRVVLLRLQLREHRILELLNGEHLPRAAYVGVVENEAHVLEHGFHRVVRRDGLP